MKEYLHKDTWQDNIENDFREKMYGVLSIKDVKYAKIQSM